MAIFAATIVFENRQSETAERLENLRFVRQTVIDGQSVKPFKGLDLAKTNLAGFPMQCTSMDSNDTNVGCSDFERANLSGSDLSDSNLTGANLMFADLSNADLKGASLREANLRGADLEGADFTGADITLVDFAETNWAKAVLDDVCREEGYGVDPQPVSNPETCEKVAFRVENQPVPRPPR